MKWSGSVLVEASLTLLLANGAFGAHLTTIDPCPSATSLSLAPITVSSQYQPVSTCEPTTACIKGKCSTIYSVTTYPYVSTAVPCAWNGTTSQITTVTDVKQTLIVSEHLETITKVTAAPTLHNGNWIDWFGKVKPATKATTTLYETVTRRGLAPFEAVGPLAIPGWDGSGLCHKCDEKQSNGGGRSQLLDVIECRSGINEAGDQYEKCIEWYETLIEQPATSVTAQGHCSSRGQIPHAGTYTWTFPQVAPPVTVTAPPVTVTVTVEGRPSVTVHRSEHVIPGQPWNAYVTKSFSGPTTFNFNVYVTKVIILEIPYFTQPATHTRPIPLPTGPHKPGHGSGRWPLPGNDPSWTSMHGGGQAWADWNLNPTTSTRSSTTLGPSSSYTASTTVKSSTSYTGSSTVGPSSSYTASTTSSQTVGPQSGSTSSSSTGSKTSSTLSSTISGGSTSTSSLSNAGTTSVSSNAGGSSSTSSLSTTGTTSISSSSNAGGSSTSSLSTTATSSSVSSAVALLPPEQDFISRSVRLLFP
ncbi:hypothetical protein HRR80_003618 [Exophiala dermatitidis]|uniref:Uncharacterized protein n=1 Tax=Exophiala dermatitidis TaxID=5970 RepID=A0AAN6IV73_EXODE|nr:hypothetical protein HRR73_002125 [Exophiala dermatitidis]KAJ4536710.1 hypothetical protein HRR76_004737 [Exophiala dermatitidis]KAJ4571995.1 hypothetical protein HRR79_003201 [Exophiala dermatitidis]KAJ4604205.1 hypothetical protein HRR84_001283 [Exophiala dermatitidis]KAJ4618821.1 hypothetical protein HRR85_001816 [Exophiala dermatitidis]